PPHVDIRRFDEFADRHRRHGTSRVVHGTGRDEKRGGLRRHFLVHQTAAVSSVMPRSLLFRSGTPNSPRRACGIRTINGDGGVPGRAAGATGHGETDARRQRAGRTIPVTSPRAIVVPSGPGAVAVTVTVSPSSRKVRTLPSANLTGSAPP